LSARRLLAFPRVGKWHIVADYTWYTVGEYSWYTVAEYFWYVLGEYHWYIIGCSVTGGLKKPNKTIEAYTGNRMGHKGDRTP
jgi:hypothetical protein